MLFSILMNHRWQSVHLIGFLFASTMLGVALYLQQVEFLLPCSICVYLRVLTILYGMTSLLALFYRPHDWGKFVYRGLFMLYSIGGVVLSLYLFTLQKHSTSLFSCEQGAAEAFLHWPLGRVLNLLFASYGDCEVMATSVFGMSLAAWSVICFSMLFLLEWVKYRMNSSGVIPAQA